MRLSWPRRIPMVLLLQLAERIWQGDKGYPSPHFALRLLINTFLADAPAEFLSGRTSIRYIGHTWILYSKCLACVHDRVSHYSVFEPRHEGHILRVLWHPWTGRVRSPIPETCNRPTEFTSNTAAKTSRHHLAKHGMDTARLPVEQHVSNFGARDGGCLDARIFLG